MTEIEDYKKTIEEAVRNFKAGSFDLKRLSEWIKHTSNDLLKVLNQREEAIKERDEALANAARGDVAKALLAQIDDTLKSAGVPTLHPDIGAEEGKPMLLIERVELLTNQWLEAKRQMP